MQEVIGYAKKYNPVLFLIMNQHIREMFFSLEIFDRLSAEILHVLPSTLQSQKKNKKNFVHPPHFSA